MNHEPAITDALRALLKQCIERSSGDDKPRDWYRLAVMIGKATDFASARKL